MGRQLKEKLKSDSGVLTAKEFQDLHGKKKSITKESNASINKRMTESFLRQCKEAGLPNPLCEYKFHSEREWKVDFMLGLNEGQLWLAVEIEGYGHHKQGKFFGDMEKYNHLTFAGIRLLRFTVKEALSGKAVNQIRRML